MPDLVQERLDALSDALARILRRMEETDRRLARIETALNLQPLPHPVANAPTEARPPGSASPQLEPVPAPPPPPPPAGPSLESRMGLTLVNRLGAITLVLGFAFFFKYAVDNRWIGETGRVCLGVLAGLALLAAGDRLWARRQAIFGQGVCGTGIAVLYLSLYASFGFYHIAPQSLVFLLMVLNTAAAGALALRYNAQAIAALGLLGGYLTPVLLSTGEDHPWVLFSYTLLLNAGGLAIAAARRWRGLPILAMAGTYILYFSWYGDRFTSEKRTVAVVFALLFYALFAWRGSALLAAFAQALGAISIMLAAHREPELFLILMLTVSAAGLFWADRRNSPAGPPATLFSFWITYFIAQLDFPHGSPAPVILLLTPLFLLFLAWAPWRLLYQRAVLGPSDYLLLVFGGPAYFGACYALLEPHHHEYAGAFAVALAAVHFAVGRWLYARDRAALPTVLLLVGVALGLLTLAIPIQLSGYRITMGWALEAAALSWIARRLEEPRLSLGAIFVLALTLLRLLLWDAWIYDRQQTYTTLANGRFFTFLAVAVALWLAACWSRAIWAYVAGHAVLLVGLCLEVLGWAARNVPLDDQLSVTSTAISILLAAYAVLLVGLGVARGLFLNRLLGLGLIGLVVLKLYLYDVWHIGRMYRIGAFAGLGALLLLTSYLYSHFRATIESWWNRDRAAE